MITTPDCLQVVDQSEAGKSESPPSGVRDTVRVYEDTLALIPTLTREEETKYAIIREIAAHKIRVLLWMEANHAKADCTPVKDLLLCKMNSDSAASTDSDWRQAALYARAVQLAKVSQLPDLPPDGDAFVPYDHRQMSDRVREVQSSESEYADRITSVFEELINARQRLMELNLPCVFVFAQSMRRGRLTFPDLIQEGALCLARIVDEFDYRRGNRLLALAKLSVHRALLKALQRERKRGDRRSNHYWHTAESQLQQELQRQPSMEETEQRATRLGAVFRLGGTSGEGPTEEQIARYLARGYTPGLKVTRALGSESSLHDRAGAGDGSEMGDQLPDPAAREPWEIVDGRLQKAHLRACLPDDPRKRFAVLASVGAGGTDQKTYAQIAADLGVSSKSVRDYVLCARRTLREELEKADQLPWNGCSSELLPAPGPPPRLDSKDLITMKELRALNLKSGEAIKIVGGPDGKKLSDGEIPLSVGTYSLPILLKALNEKISTEVDDRWKRRMKEILVLLENYVRQRQLRQVQISPESLLQSDDDDPAMQMEAPVLQP